MRNEIVKNNKFAVSIAPQSASSAVNGVAVDTLGFNGAELQASFGATAVGTIKLQTSDTAGGTYTDLGDAITLTTAAHANKTVGLVVPETNLGGAKRYLRAVLTPTSATVVSANIILTRPGQAPVTQ